jgi:hypothetical protein
VNDDATVYPEQEKRFVVSLEGLYREMPGLRDYGKYGKESKALSSHLYTKPIL